ncbi:MAG: hypothetical protein CMN77_17980 [Spirochaetaceae bacterium]|nr:hypothetical protein [Spirochaetaceae bacterium]|tara:strand:+ start:569 stop:1219 length:651 start_codon:yes stop_codon:yes gene_type:complete
MIFLLLRNPCLQASQILLFLAVLLYPGISSSEPFITDKKSPAEIMQQMRKELEIDPLGSQVPEKVSAVSHTILQREAILKFDEGEVRGLLALPARKISILTSSGLRKIRINEIDAVRFIEKSTAMPESKELSDSRSMPDFDDPVGCKLSLSASSDARDTVTGICDAHLWSELFIRFPGQSYRPINSEILDSPSGSGLRLKEVNFPDTEPGRLGGRS